MAFKETSFVLLNSVYKTQCATLIEVDYENAVFRFVQKLIAEQITLVFCVQFWFLEQKKIWDEEKGQ